MGQGLPKELGAGATTSLHCGRQGREVRAGGPVLHGRFLSPGSPASEAVGKHQHTRPSRLPLLQWSGLGVARFGSIMIRFTVQVLSFLQNGGRKSSNLKQKMILKFFQVEMREAEVKGPGPCCVDLANLHPGDTEIGKPDTVLPQFP